MKSTCAVIALVLVLGTASSSESGQSQTSSLAGRIELAHKLRGYIAERIKHWKEAVNEKDLSYENKQKRLGMAAGLEEADVSIARLQDADESAFKSLPPPTGTSENDKARGSESLAQDVKAFLDDRITHWILARMEPDLAKHNILQRMGMVSGLEEVHDKLTQWNFKDPEEKSLSLTLELQRAYCTAIAETGAGKTRDELYVLINGQKRLPEPDGYWGLQANQEINNKALDTITDIKQGLSAEVISLGEQENKDLKGIVEAVKALFSALTGGDSDDAANAAQEGLRELGNLPSGDNHIGTVILKIARRRNYVAVEWTPGDGVTIPNATPQNPLRGKACLCTLAVKGRYEAEFRAQWPE